MAPPKHDASKGKVEQLNFFAAVPGRVTSDRRLKEIHLRLLIVIAGYDRMGRNGRSCFAGSKTLAGQMGCADGSFRNAASDLIAWGYLKVEKDKADKRRAGYAVVYRADADAAGIGVKRKADVSSVGDINRGRNVSPMNDTFAQHASFMGDRNQQDMSPIDDTSDVNKAMEVQIYQIVREAYRKPNIFCETENINREAHEKLAIGERYLGSGKGLEALPVVEQITNATWAYVVRQLRAGTLTDVQLEVAMEEGRQRMAEKVANG